MTPTRIAALLLWAVLGYVTWACVLTEVAGKHAPLEPAMVLVSAAALNIAFGIIEDCAAYLRNRRPT